MSSTTFPFEEASARRTLDRRLSTAIAISFVVHALAVSMVRGFLPPIHISGEGGAGSLPALYATLVAPVASPATAEPPMPEAPIDPPPLAAPAGAPAISSGSALPAAKASGSGTRTNLPSSADVNVSVGTIADPARLGADYAAELAQRFPAPVQQPPQLRGVTSVDYPREALERGLQGRFAVVIGVDAVGKPTDVKLVTNDPVFGPALLDALKRMQFAPAQDNGTPVPYWAIVEFVFTIGKSEPPATLAAQAPAHRGISLPRQSAGRK